MDQTKIEVRLEYLKHIEQQKESGLSIREYCEQYNLIDHKFTYYRNYKLKSSSKSESVFSKVQIKPSSQGSLKPETVDKLNVAKIDPHWLAQFLNCLLSLR